MANPENDAAQELALKVVRILARGGCNLITKPNIEKALLKTTFFKDYWDRIETDEKKIEFALCAFSAGNSEIPASNFYLLPFKKSDYLITLFRPHFFSDYGCKVDIIQICAWPNDLAVGYRIERGRHGNNDIHGYLHVQMTPNFSHPAGDIALTLPPGLSKSYPAYPIPHHLVYASLYSALVAFAGLRWDWLGGLVDEFEKCRDYYSGTDFDDVSNKLKGVCKALFL